MAQTSTARPLYAPNYTGPRFLGAPVGDFSVLQTLLISVAVGVSSFFAATFLAIVVMLVLLTIGHKPDFSIAYRLVGLPVGIGMLIITLGYLGSLLATRLRRKATGQ